MSDQSTSHGPAAIAPLSAMASSIAPHSSKPAMAIVIIQSPYLDRMASRASYASRRPSANPSVKWSIYVRMPSPSIGSRRAV